MDSSELEKSITHMIREYECVPRKILYQRFCSEDNEQLNRKRKRKLSSCLRRLVRESYINYRLNEDVYCLPTSDGKVSKRLIKSLWILNQFSDINEEYAGTKGVLIFFMLKDDDSLYEIIHLSSKDYRITAAAINGQIDSDHIPKRIVLVDGDDEADRIPKQILKEINCITMCTVAADGSIESYDF